MQAQFVRAQESDAPALIAMLVRISTDGHGQGGQWTSCTAMLPELLQAVQGHIVYKIDQEGETVGCVVLHELPDERLQIDQICVEPGHQGQQIATQALEFLEYEFPDTVCWVAEVPADLAAGCHLCEQMGYHCTGERTVEGQLLLHYEKNLAG